MTDDALQRHVTVMVRGRDLYRTTAVQRLLQGFWGCLHRFIAITS